MSNVTKEEMDVLIKLQEIETGAYKINKKLEDVDHEISSRLKKKQQVENEFEKIETELNEVRKQYKDLEFEVKQREERVEKSENHLKNVKTNTEYQALLREIDDNKKRNAEAEAHMIEYLDQIESKEKESRECKERLETITKTVETEVSEIESTTVNDREELVKIEKRRDEVAKGLNPKLLNMFNKILKQSSGLAIVAMSNATCGGCFMNVPPQKFIEIQRGESLNFCPQCHRILYYKGN